MYAKLILHKKHRIAHRRSHTPFVEDLFMRKRHSVTINMEFCHLKNYSSAVFYKNSCKQLLGLDNYANLLFERHFHFGAFLLSTGIFAHRRDEGFRIRWFQPFSQCHEESKITQVL